MSLELLLATADANVGVRDAVSAIDTQHTDAGGMVV